MYSDSRKAQYNSFAHHRARLLFTKMVAEVGGTDPWSASIHEGTERQDQVTTLQQRVIAGVRGFSPSSIASAH